MSAEPPRDILVVLREELVIARAELVEADEVPASEPVVFEVSAAARKLELAANTLERTIKGPFDGVMLDLHARTFRQSSKKLHALLEVRRERQRSAPHVVRLLQRLEAHAQQLAQVTEKAEMPTLAKAMAGLANVEGWQGAPLDAAVRLCDTLIHLSRQKLGPAATEPQLQSLVDRAESTALVSLLHGLKDLGKRGSKDATLLRDRFALEKAMAASVDGVVTRLSGWLVLDEPSQLRLRQSVEQFAHRLVERLMANAPKPTRAKKPRSS